MVPPWSSPFAVRVATPHASAFIDFDARLVLRGPPQPRRRDPLHGLADGLGCSAIIVSSPTHRDAALSKAAVVIGAR